MIEEPNSGQRVGPDTWGVQPACPCFTPGTLIATPRGEVPVETLKIGDEVVTRDNGIQVIRWAGQRTLNRYELADHLGTLPVFIKAGALGNNLPERDMLLSQEHRILIAGLMQNRNFDDEEVLVAAKHLVGRAGIGIKDTKRLTYVHFMFDRHEVVLSDGMWSESFQPADNTLGALGDDMRTELLSIYPDLTTVTGLKTFSAARRSLTAEEAKSLQF